MPPPAPPRSPLFVIDAQADLRRLPAGSVVVRIAAADRPRPEARADVDAMSRSPTRNVPAILGPEDELDTPETGDLR